MGHEIELPKDSDILHAKAWDWLTTADLMQLTSDIVNASLKHDLIKVLVDCTNMDARVTTVDIYELPRLYEKLGMKRAARIAVLFPDHPKKKVHYQFYETAAFNAGYKVKLFTDPSDAYRWLHRN